VTYLIDTCVISELRRPQPNPGVVRFVERNEFDHWLSVLTVGELLRGLHAMTPGRRRDELREWIHRIEADYSLRIIPIDLDTVHIWGEVTGKLRREGIQIATADGLIAATAIQHGLHVVTRNVKDFEPTGAPVINPWEVWDEDRPE
jgi:predicted nucleic acid-binding protein